MIDLVAPFIILSVLGIVIVQAVAQHLRRRRRIGHLLPFGLFTFWLALTYWWLQ